MSIDDWSLQRYFDGDLPESEASAVREALKQSSELQSRLDSLSRLRQLLQVASAEHEKGLVGSEELYKRVVARRGPKLHLLRGGSKKVVASMVGATAIAAIFALAFLGEHVGRKAGSDGQQVGSFALGMRPRRGSDVVAVDFGERPGTVFTIGDPPGQQIAVVWIHDIEVKEGQERLP